MEQKTSKTVKLLSMLFVLISIFYIFYASCSQRGLYSDGCAWFIKILDNIADNKIQIFSEPGLPRVFASYLQQIPVLIAGIIFGIKSKLTLAIIYSFTMFSIPFLAIWWNYELTKRTKQYAVLFWSIFTYCILILPSQIAIYDNINVSILIQFILLNYILGKVHYNKWDKAGILFLIIMMFCINESVFFTGAILFLATILMAFETEDPQDLLVKVCIGAGSLFASFHTIFYIIFNHDSSIISRIKWLIFETKTSIINMGNFSFLIPILTIFLLAVLCKKKKRFSKYFSLFIGFLYFLSFYYMFTNLKIFLVPLYETYTKNIVILVLPIIFAGILLYKYKFSHKGEQPILINNAYILVLLCGITLTAWQILQTNYWNQNITYLKKEIKKNAEVLYIPEEHKEIGSHFNRKLRRYIPYTTYAAYGIVFNDNYEIKPFIMHMNFGKTKKECKFNDIKYSLNEYLWTDIENEIISIPSVGSPVKISNKFWDIKNASSAIEDYNQEKGIKTEKKQESEKQEKQTDDNQENE